MKIDKNTVEKMAHLSRIQLNEKDAEKMISSMTKITNWMDLLKDVDTTSVEPLVQMSDEVNVLRVDKAEPSLDHEKSLANAPSRDINYFRVPKVLE